MKTNAPNAKHKTIAELIKTEVFAAAYFVGLLGVLIVFAYFYWFKARLGLHISKNPDAWGQFGDYVGGILNPVCAYMAFVWLVRSYSLQKTELAETRKALEESREAQQEQARLALLSAQTQTLNIRLSAVISTLSNLRASHARAIEFAESRGRKYPMIVDDGTLMPAELAIDSLYRLIRQAESTQGAIIDELNKISK